MATLVLGAIGTLVGGPLGGAIGATLGRGLDREIIGNGRREGPRLTELAVSTSSYGQPIPGLYGRVRVPGSVIWASDLAEQRPPIGCLPRTLPEYPSVLLRHGVPMHKILEMAKR